MNDPSWTAPKTGHDWRDEDILRFTAWMRSLAPENLLDQRINDTRARFLTLKSKDHGSSEEKPPLYDARDKVAWYVFQAETYADGREFWIPEESVRIAPVMKRLGQGLDALRSIEGVEDRVRRLLGAERAQPDAVLFELVVALAYQRHGWRVEFVPENSRQRSHDMNVSRPRRKWAVECKRLMPSGYADMEKTLGKKLAAPVHAHLRERDISIVVEVIFAAELKNVPLDYVLNHVKHGLRRSSVHHWKDRASVASMSC